VTEPFRELMSITKCPFARSARVVFSSDWNKNASFQKNIAVHARELEAFAQRIEDERLHGFVSKVGCVAERPSFDEVRRSFGRYLFGLAATDDSCQAAMNEEIVSLNWQFTHSGVRMFLNVFASCYPVKHSKFCDVKNGFYVLFQPERSFDFCGGVDLRSFKHIIRARFAAAGMPYNDTQIDKRIEALIYMFPSEPFGAPVEWWHEA
jgi:YqcI/YcgG family